MRLIKAIIRPNKLEEVKDALTKLSVAGMTVCVVLCAIVGDSIGYWVGDKWGDRLLKVGPLKKCEKGIEVALDQLRRRGATAVSAYTAAKAGTVADAGPSRFSCFRGRPRSMRLPA